MLEKWLNNQQVVHCASLVFLGFLFLSLFYLLFYCYCSYCGGWLVYFSYYLSLYFSQGGLIFFDSSHATGAVGGRSEQGAAWCLVASWD